MLQNELEQWIGAVRRADADIAVKVKALAKNGIKVERNLHDRDVSAICYVATFQNADSSRTTVYLRFMDFQSKRDLVITNMTTLPIEKASQGHGTRAVQHVLNWAKSNGICSILATQVSNERSKNFWIRNGFERVLGTVTGDYESIVKV